jgi:LPPG:FO 2-phospho-L-lactate transferase
MGALERLGGESWFRLGDGDLATHVERSWRMAEGASLSAVTACLCAALGIGPRVLPMSDDPVRTRVLTETGWLDFQEYFVHRQCEPRVRDFMFAGVDVARPAPGLLETLDRPDLRAVIICPSNPFVSIEPILAIGAIRTAVQRARAPVLAVTPIIGGKAIKGPAAKMLLELGLDASATAVARRYIGIIDGFVVDSVDGPTEPVPGVESFSAPTLMSRVEDRLTLAREVLRIIDTIEVGGRHHGRAQWIERAS